MSIATFIWFCFISILLTNKKATNKFKKFIPWIEKIIGFLLIFIAVQIFIQDGSIKTILFF